MKLRPTVTEIEIKVGHLFCGLGGGAKGFNKGEARLGSLRAKFVCVGGIDSNPAAIADFERLAGVPGTILDLFSREQYIAYWGHEPPIGWRPAGVDDIRRAYGNQRPHILFLSAPCQGFSGLLAESKSKHAKYIALNELTVRGVWLALEAFKDDPPEFILFENVPRIAKRGRYLLDQIVAILRSYGFVVAETTHDCGELGALGQSRKRFLLVARHAEKVPSFLYQPIKHPLKGVGEIIGRFPVPGPEAVLPMHRMPSLQWKTWVRLAFVEAGADWRSLNKLNVADGFLTDFGIAPDYGYRSTFGVNEWEEARGVIGTRGGPTNGNNSVADPRIDGERNGPLGVNAWNDSSGVVGCESFPTNGPNAVADPRELRKHDFHGLKVNEWEGKAAGAVTGMRSSPGSSAQSIADPRIDGHPKSVQMGVGGWNDTAAALKGDVSVGTGRYAVADPRILGRPRFNHVFRIVRYSDAANAVSGGGGPAGGLGLADPRFTNWHPGASSTKMRVAEWKGRAAGTVTGAQQVGSGALALADPRHPFGPGTRHNVLRVHEFDDNANAISGGHGPSSGGQAVADPRPGENADYQQVKYRVTRGDEAAGAVIAASTTGNGAFALADPRPDCLKQEGDAYQSGGHYGVVPWPRNSNAVSASALHDNGFNNVADPRPGPGTEILLPKPDARLVCCIRAVDGTWHRPFTTLELAALQGLVDPEETLELEGLSDSAWRERIGNAVPPPAAQAIAGVMGRALLAAWSGHTFSLDNAPIWVRGVAVGISVNQGGGVYV